MLRTVTFTLCLAWATPLLADQLILGCKGVAVVGSNDRGQVAFSVAIDADRQVLVEVDGTKPWNGFFTATTITGSLDIGRAAVAVAGTTTISIDRITGGFDYLTTYSDTLWDEWRGICAPGRPQF